jgi:hypothetical protein
MTWTAAVMSDDHLDPDSLVGRMLTPSWQEWPGGECPRCGYHDLEIQNTAEHGWATDGDPIRCCRCGLVGWMNVDAEDSCDEMFPDDYEDLSDDWESPPSPATVEPMPLWRVMWAAYDESQPDAFRDDPGSDAPMHSIHREGYAAEIEALRDYIVPEELEPYMTAWPDPACLKRHSGWAERQRLRAILTEQARIARGEP